MVRDSVNVKIQGAACLYLPDSFPELLRNLFLYIVRALLLLDLGVVVSESTHP